MQKIGMAVLAGGALASVVNSVVLMLARGAGYSMRVSYSHRFATRLAVEQVISCCFLVALLAGVILVFLRNMNRKAGGMFQPVIGILLVVALVSLAFFGTDGNVTRAILGVMYVAGFGSILFAFRKFGALKK